jgi:hypothetical protein
MTGRSPFYRWGPLAGVLFVVLTVIGFSVSGSSPDPDASNAKISAFLASDSNYNKNVVGLFLVLAAGLALVGFFASLRLRLAEAEGGLGGAAALALGAGVVSVVFFVLGILLFISPTIAAHDAKKALLDPGIFRLAQDLGYSIWIGSVIVGSLAVWATSAVVLRTGFLPRWFAWFGIVVGVIGLFAIFFFPIFLYWLWIIVAGILMFLRPAQPVVAAPAI